MRIGVIGGGAVGLLISAYFSRRYSVTVYTKTEEQAKILEQKGIHITGEQPFTAHLYKATNNPEYREELLIVTVKQYQLPSILSILETLPSRTVIFLQNGMSHIASLEKLKHHQVILGIVEHGVLKVGFNEVNHTGRGQIVLSPYHLDEYDLNVLTNEFNDFFPIKIHSDWYSLLAKKLLANAVINPLTALWKVRNGELFNNEHFKKEVKLLFDEIWEVLELEGKEEHFQYIKSICEKTAKNQSSMLRDILEERPTEIDAILGYVLTNARQKEVNLPLTTFVYHSLKGLERKNSL